MLKGTPPALILDLDPDAVDQQEQRSPAIRDVYVKIFWRRESVLKSDIDQFIPLNCIKLWTKPVDLPLTSSRDRTI